jgi:hypothetical protein
MRKNRKITPYIVLILLYIISILPIIYLTILLVGKADTVLVFCFGSVNTIFLMRYYKGNLFLSFLLGFFVSSFTLCFIYVLWFLGLSSKSLLPTIFFIIASVILCIVLAENHLKITSTRNIHFFILLPTIVFLVGSINLKESYPTKFENKNLTYAQIKIVDKQKKPRIGDTIEVRIWRQPLFGIRGSHEIYKTTTNENGIAKIQFSTSNNYHLTITTTESKLDSFDINSQDLKTKKMFVIEE